MKIRVPFCLKRAAFLSARNSCIAFAIIFYSQRIWKVKKCRSWFLKVKDENIKTKYVMRCAIWYQMLKNGVPTVGQNTVLTSYNALQRLSQKSVSLNPFWWHSNSYLMFKHSYGMYMALERHTNGRSRKNSNCSIATKIATLIATLKAHDEIRVRRRIFTFKTLIYV